MGCLVALDCVAADEATALQAVEAAWEALLRVAQRMNPAAPGSDLARLNDASPGEVVRVDPWTTQVLRLARRLCRLGGGLFDPGLPGGGSVRTLIEQGDGAWRLRERVRLDLGGIAKGYAVDRAVQAMRSQGARGGLVNAGGDLRCFGRQARLVEWRCASAPAQRLVLHSGALACSEPGAPGAPPAHRGYYRRDEAGAEAGTGVAQAPPPAVAVLARDCALADAMSKVFLLAPAADYRRLERLTGTRLLAPGRSPATRAAQPGRTCPEPRTTYL